MRHPVHALLAHHAHFGTVPTAKELDGLGISAEHRKQVEDAAAEAVRLRGTGDRRAANTHALDSAYAIVADLPKEQQDPRAFHTDPLEDVTDPDELAAAVRPAGGW